MREILADSLVFYWCMFFLLAEDMWKNHLIHFFISQYATAEHVSVMWFEAKVSSPGLKHGALHWLSCCIVLFFALSYYFNIAAKILVNYTNACHVMLWNICQMMEGHKLTTNDLDILVLCYDNYKVQVIQ